MMAMAKSGIPMELRYAALTDARGGPKFAHYSDRHLDGSHPCVECAIAVVHGTSRDGDRYFRAVRRARRASGEDQRHKTLIVAPLFLSHRTAHKSGIPPETLVWKSKDWKEGNASRCRRASSFDVLDSVLARFTSKERFPNLTRVVVAGHSAGAQLVQRYAAASPTEEALRARGVAVRYLVANPSSYLYLDRSRPGFGADGGLAEPPRAIRESCPDYNSYKYGLEALNPYLALLGPEKIRRQYGEREVIYLLGGRDDDPATKNLDRSCAAQLQGATRLERGLAFRAHLRQHQGEEILARHVFEVVAGIGHEGPRILGSAAGRRWLFATE